MTKRRPRIGPGLPSVPASSRYILQSNNLINSMLETLQERRSDVPVLQKYKVIRRWPLDDDLG